MAENLSHIDKNDHSVERHFRMIGDLFTLARDSAIDSKMSAYDYFNGPPDASKAISLPPELAGLAPQDIPLQDPYLVHYEDRRSGYYSGSRGEFALLSSVLDRGASDDKITELQYSQEVETDGLVGTYLTVDQYINEKSFRAAQGNDQAGFDKPHGSMRVKFQLAPDMSRQLSEMKASRLDETEVDWQGPKLTRWLRDLHLEQNGDEKTIEYSDRYLVGLRTHGGSEARAQVKIIINESPGKCTATVEIGLGPTIVPIKQGHGLNILGTKESAEDLEILRHDPSYGFLFDSNASQKDIISELRARVATLIDHWDQSESVIGEQVQNLNAAPSTSIIRAKEIL